MLTPLIRVYGYVLLTVSFLGYWLWTGIGCLTIWLLDPAYKKSVGQPLIFGGWSLCWMLLLPATLLWYAPELLKREIGPQPKSAKGLVGYLLRSSDKGVFDGSLSLTLETAAPPPHFWLVGVLFAVFSGYWVMSGSGGLRGSFWVIPCWVGFAACVTSLGLLTHGALIRRVDRRRVAAERRNGLGGAG